MGMFLAAAAAYIVGANAGKQNFDNVVHSLDAIRRSDEFRDLVEAVRIHVAGTLREVAGAIDQPGASTPRSRTTSSSA